MYWTVNVDKECHGVEEDRPCNGRFVLHGHRDEMGEHLDLRLEQSGYLTGWRIQGPNLCDGAWATAKLPHPLHWLDEDHDAVRRDEGVYTWERLVPEEGVLLLKGAEGMQRITLRRDRMLTPDVAKEVVSAITDCGIRASDAGRLIRDGAVSRQRAIERLCGLGRELDGDAFEDEVWRKAVGSLSLDEIHTQLRSFEVRFDLKHPPQPVSRPESLPEIHSEERAESALSILRG